MMTLAGMLCGAAAARPAVTDAAGTVDYVGLCNAADAVAAALAAHGVAAGDRVAGAFPDGAAFLAAFAGAAVCRAAFAPVPRGGDELIRAHLRGTAARLVLAPPDAPQGVRVAAAALGIPVLTLGFSPEGTALIDGEPVYDAHGRLADADDVAFVAADGATYTHAALVDAALAASRRVAGEARPPAALTEPAGLIGALAVLSGGGHLVLATQIHAAAA